MCPRLPRLPSPVSENWCKRTLHVGFCCGNRCASPSDQQELLAGKYCKHTRCCYERNSGATELELHWLKGRWNAEVKVTVMGSELGPETVSGEEEKREARPDSLHPAFSAASPGRSWSPCALSVCLSVCLPRGLQGQNRQLGEGPALPKDSVPIAVLFTPSPISPARRRTFIMSCSVTTAPN